MAEVLAAKAGIFLASEAAKVLIELVTKRSADDAAVFVWGSRNHHERLSRRLERVQAFLEDLGTNKSEHSSQLVTKWLKAVKNVAYLADNLMDDYEYQKLRTKLKLNNSNNNNNNNNYCFPRICSSFDILFRIRMYCKVREILAEFDEVDKGADAIGLRQVELATNAIACSNNQNNNQAMISTAAWNQAREHASYTAGFVGREKDVEVLLDLVCHPNDIIDDAGDGLYTVAIVGMGGLGKTTLARHVYDHEKTDAQFNNNKHWISATDFNVTRILNQMAESANLNRALSNTDVIISSLKDKIKGNKMLVVLDDVWEDNGELWDSFKGRLRGIGALPGSVILITTRKHVVAAKAGVESPHFLQPLSSDESWAILEKGLIRSNVCSHMEEVGRRIVEKCKGVPLAIKVMGSLLKSKQCLSEWEKFDKSEVWDLPQGQNEIFPSLLLSFNHLPYPSLKQCFAYFAMIPKGNHVYKSELVGLWQSQGYLRNNDKRTTMEEDIGEEYIQILVSQSLLEEYEPGRSDFFRYKMHVLVHDLAAYVSRNELTKDVKDLRENHGFRHLEFSSGEEMGASNFPADRNVARMIRTIRFMGCVPWDLLIHTRYLHTLFLDRTGVTELPSDIERLKHLRYLDVSHNPISTLPDSIGKLYQLETLILNDCKNMRKLPKVLNTLVSLRHISTTVPIYAWKGLRRLGNLKTLPHLCLDDDNGDGWSIDELGELDGLRDEIYIDGLECVKDKEQAKKAGLARKATITKLALSWDNGRQGICNDEDVLDALEPHPNITSLEVENFNGERFPTWVTRMAVLTEEHRGITTILSNLTVVKLEGCFRCRTLPTLGQLPFLESLVLDGFDVDCIGNEFYGSDMPTTVVSFQNLKELEVSRLSRLITTWMAPPQGAFSRLEILRVTECCLLESLPAGLGSKSLASLLLGNLNCMRSLDIIKYSAGLTSLEMSNMPEIRSLPEELANCTKLMSLHIGRFEKLVSLPSGGLTTLVSLRSLDMRKCPMMEAATIDVSKLVGLSELFISCNSVQHLRTLLQALEHLPRLKSLRIEDVVPFENEDEMKDCFSEITPYNNQPSITDLGLSGLPKIKTLPRQLGLLTRITSLFIWDFEDLEEIPDWICDLSFLEELSLYGFENLKRLPSKEALQRLPRLKTLKFVLCPMLEERYAKDHGREWHAISHISHIVIDIPC